MTATTRAPRLLDGAASAAPAFPRVGTSEPAESEAERAYRRGLQEGLDEGRRLAEENIAHEVAATRARLAEAIAGLVASAQEFQRDRERQVLAVALEAASRIVRMRIDDGDPVAARAARDAVDAVPESSTIRFRICPADREAIVAELQTEIARGRLEIIDDASLERGGCVAESAVGTIDARIATAERAMQCAAAPGRDS